MPITTLLLAHAPLAEVRAAVEPALAAIGWTVTAEEDGPVTTRLILERGSRLKTLLLGGGAADDLHLRHVVTLSESVAGRPRLSGPDDAETVTEIRYPTSGGGSITRGGPYGADRDLRLHELGSERIVTVLREAGIAVGRL